MRTTPLHRPLTVALTCALLAGSLSACLEFGGDDENAIEIPTPLGKLVLYVAERDGLAPGEGGDRVWVADTGGTPNDAVRLVTLGEDLDATLLGALSATGPLVYAAATDPTDNCPSQLRFVDRATAAVTRHETDGCVAEWRANAAGTRVVFERTDIGGGNAALQLTDAALATPVDLSAGGVAASTVDLWDFAPAVNIVAWTDATGVWWADLSPTLDAVAPQQVNADLPTSLFAVTPDGTAVVYYLFADQRFYLQPLDGSPRVALTNAVGGTYALLSITADGERIVYTLDTGGGSGLWTVALDSPLTEQQIDATAPLGGFFVEYALSPDGGRIAWVTDGVAGTELVAAEFADLATVVTLTPTTEEPVEPGVWATPMTLAYVSDDSDQITPTGASALRTVNFASPLITVVHGDDETVGTRALDAVACSDGTLLWVKRDDTGADDVSSLMTATPLIAGSEAAIAPDAVRTLGIPGITEYACTE